MKLLKDVFKEIQGVSVCPKSGELNISFIIHERLRKRSAELPRQPCCDESCCRDNIVSNVFKMDVLNVKTIYDSKR